MDARRPQPQILVVDASPRFRLRVVSALTGPFQVESLPGGDDALRVARARRPELVLFAMDRANADDVLRMCRTLRTDVRPIERVAVYAHGRPPRPVDVVIDGWRADGYLAGDLDAPALLAFAEALLRGERTVSVPEAADGILGRLADRLRRR